MQYTTLNLYAFFVHLLCKLIEYGGKVRIIFVFGRNQFNFFLTVCLPTVLANVMGHLTNYFYNFEIAVGVNLTLMLVISTM